jgi:hypothetical protein
MEKRLDGVPVALHAIDLLIADIQSRSYDERDEDLALLHDLRARLIERAE